MTRIAIVTGANDGYWPLLKGTLASLAAARGRGGPDFDVCVLDLGLADDQRAAIAAQGANVVAPGWDLEFPDRDAMPRHFQAMTARPFLPRHFPGFDLYMWIDADAWVQDAGVLGVYLDAAKAGTMALAAQIDRAYKQHYKRGKLFGWTHNHKHYRLGWGWRAADRYGRMPILNSGAFALTGDAPHWDAWADTLAAGLKRTRHKLVEQTALNLAIYRDKLPATFLPAWCNWLCDAARPMVDRAGGLLVEPHAPHRPLGIVHLAGEFERDGVLELEALDGGRLASGLRYDAFRKTLDE
jgi:hypothetical protein